MVHSALNPHTQDVLVVAEHLAHAETKQEQRYEQGLMTGAAIGSIVMSNRPMTVKGILTDGLVAGAVAVGALIGHRLIKKLFGGHSKEAEVAQAVQPCPVCIIDRMDMRVPSCPSSEVQR